MHALQRRLTATGYAPGPLDGLYGPLTERAVRRFQGAYGLLVDGIAGSLTLRSLAARAPVIHPGAGYASDGSGPVRALQRHLARAGFRLGPVDGFYGPLTEQAVMRFQTAHGLSVDGVAGPQTLSRLWTHAASRPRPFHPARRKPTGTAPASPKAHDKRPIPATQKPAGAEPKAERGPSHGTGFGSILLIGLCIAALLVVPFEIGRQMRSGRVATSPEPRPHDAPDTSSVAVATAATSVPPDEGDPPPEGTESVNGHLDSRMAQPAQGNGVQPALPENGVAAAFDRGGELADGGDFAGAEAAYRRAADGGHGDAASNLGVLLERRGDVEGAEAAYRRADALGRAVGAFNLGGMLAQRGDDAGAEAAYRRAAEAGDATAALNLGSILADRGDCAAAETAYRQAEDSGSAAAAPRLGELLEQRGDLLGAEAVYRRGAQRGDPEAAFNLASLLLHRGEIASAEAAFRQAADRGDADAASNLGVLLDRRGDDVGAEAAYRLADRQGHAVGAFNLGIVLEVRGDLSGAEAAYRRAGQRGHIEVARAAHDALQQLRGGP